MHRTYSISPCHCAYNSCPWRGGAGAPLSLGDLERLRGRTWGLLVGSGRLQRRAAQGKPPAWSFMHWIRANRDGKGLAETWICQRSVICKTKTKAIESVGLNTS